MDKAWIFLGIAGLFEIVLATQLKCCEGFTRLTPSLGVVVATVLSFYFLSRSLQALPVGTAYAVWTGIGAVGTALVGIWLFGDSVSWMRLGCIVLICTGVVGLKFTS